MATQKNTTTSLDDRLINAAAALNLKQVSQLLHEGANPKYIRYSDPNAWYQGNSDTALYVATHANFKQKGGEENYVNVLETLLKAGSNPNFKATRGNWNHATSYPLFSNIYHNLNSFSDVKQKIRFVQLFIKYGVNINQVQSHGRSKNWRGYSNKTCFIFQAMAGCGILSKIQQLKINYNTINFQQLRQMKQKQLEKQFLKQFPEFLQLAKEEQQQQQQQQQAQQQQPQQQKPKKDPEVSFIEALLNFGVSPDSFTSQSYWQNYENENYEEGEYEMYSKYDQTINEVYQTLLHRAIMNNLPGLVKILIEKGAKLTKLKFTVVSPAYPQDWPEKVQQRRKAKVLQDLRQYETSKAEYEEQLQAGLSEQDAKDVARCLKSNALAIFKAKRFNIENQPPQPIYQVKQISCLELAQTFKVSQEIIQLIKEAESKAKEAKPNAAKIK